MFQSLFLFLILLVPMSCGVKDKSGTNQGGGNESAVMPGNLPKGVLATKEGKFLVLPSAREFTPGEVVILYKVITDAMDPVSQPEFSMEVQYWMPEMPEMPVTPAKIEYPSAGQIRVTYDISMGGLWDFTLKVKRNGGVVDTLSFRYNVQEPE